MTVYSAPISKAILGLPSFANDGTLDSAGRVYPLPPMPSPATTSGPTIVMNDNRVIDAKGADTGTIERLKALLDADKRARPAEVAKIVADLKSRGHL